MLSPTTNPAEERRAEPRRVCHKHCLVRFDRWHLDGQAGSVGAEGCLSDLSARGVGLLLRTALPAGATLTITTFGLAVAPMAPAHVVRCVPVGRCWRHSCCLKRRLSEEELQGWLE
jgi:hypothetical protein